MCELAEAVPVRDDLEGKLILISGQDSTRFAKRLPTARAWHNYDPRDLEFASSEVLSAVRSGSASGHHLLEYSPALQPQTLTSLREILPIDDGLATWRISRFLRDLCDQLIALHRADVPQLVLHPERIGLIDDHPVIMPTLACVLPPLPDLPANTCGGWLHFVAPEVLRTRGLRRGLLPGGDGYSLARLGGVLLSPDWEPDLRSGTLAIAERRVESNCDDPGSIGEGPGDLVALLARAGAHDPEDRLSVVELRSSLDALCEDWSPRASFDRALEQGDLSAASEVCQAVQRAIEEGTPGCSPVSLYLMDADLASHRSPPDWNTTVINLDKAIGAGARDVQVFLKKGRALAAHRELENHLVSSARAYRNAARKSGWTEEIQNEWATVLSGIEDGREVLKSTQDVPPSRRTEGLIAERSRRRIHQGLFMDAWYEIAGEWLRLSPSPRLAELAGQAARGGWENAKASLMLWRSSHEEKEGYAALIAIVWERAGNLAMARQWNGRAESARPGEGES